MGQQQRWKWLGQTKECFIAVYRSKHSHVFSLQPNEHSATNVGEKEPTSGSAAQKSNVLPEGQTTDYCRLLAAVGPT
jgi:hypothetical protein